MIYIIYTLFFVNSLFILISSGAIDRDNSTRSAGDVKIRPKASRRILRGKIVGETRPYMVYLRAASGANPKLQSSNWLCGGIIIHPRYILTSAACIEDAQHFYVVSGTHTWVPADDQSNECIINGAKKATWKCVPKEYSFDGDEFDNIRWMIGDIAVVKVEDDFNFEKKIKGCDFIPSMVKYNNESLDLEKSGTVGSAAGWGSTASFGDLTGRSTANSYDLLETDVVLMSKSACRKRWDPRYHFIIEENMVCSRDTADDSLMSAACEEQQIDCKELEYSDETEDDGVRRKILISDQLEIDTAAHIDKTRRRHRVPSGGFCENDHGGPLVVGQGKSSVVVGVMSACLTKEITQKCYGPFLYTSTYKYRNMISCVINKETGLMCRKFLRASKSLRWDNFDRSQNVQHGPESLDPFNKSPRSNNNVSAPAVLSKHKLMSVTSKKS